MVNVINGIENAQGYTVISTTPATTVNPRAQEIARLSGRSGRVHTLHGPLSDFGLDPSNRTRSQPDGCGKTLFPDQLIDARFREARDRFHFW
jgi:hypothetical protein